MVSCTAMTSAPPTTDDAPEAPSHHDEEFSIGGWGWWAIGGALGTAVALGTAFIVLMSATGTPSYTERPDTPGIVALPEDVVAAAAAGEVLATDLGCMACHSVDGSDGVGPTWAGIWGHEAELEGGETAEVDAAYISTSILEPNSQIVAGFAAAMPTFDLSDDELGQLAAYISTLE